MIRWLEPTLWNLATQQTVQVTLTAMVVWLLVKLFAYDRPHLAHALWALVLLKCIMPPVLALPTSPFSWFAQSASTSETAVASKGIRPAVSTPTTFPNDRTDGNAEAAIPLPTSAVVHLQSGLPRPIEITNANAVSKGTEPHGWFATWRGGLLVAWFVSSVISLLCVTLRLRRFLTKVRRASLNAHEATVQQLTSEMQRLAKLVGLRAGLAARVRVQVVDANIGPAVVGLLRPTILLPSVIVEESSPDELELLLAHELTHVRRGDLAWASLQTLTTSLWWFHPLVLGCARWFDREVERSCDEETIASVGCHPATYARSLLSVLERKHQLQIAPALPGVRPMDITRKRMDRIMRMEHGSHARSPWWCSGVLLIGAAVALPGAAWVVAQDNVLESKPTADLRLPELRPQASAEAITTRHYDLTETLEKTQQGRARAEALREIKQFVRSAAERSLVASATPVTSDLGVQGYVAVLLSDEAIEIDEDEKLIARGGPELQQSVRNELDRLKQFGTETVIIETRFISIPAELLKALEVDWELLQDNSVVSAAASTNVTSEHPSEVSNPVVTASAASATNYRLPVLTAQLSPQALAAMLATIHSNPKSNDMMCPKVAMFNGTQASIRDSIERPFVVGMQAMKSGDKEAQQPVVRLIPSGMSLQLRPELQDDKLSLQCSIELSKIEDVGTFSYRRTGQAAGAGVTLQVPRVAATSIQCQAEAMASGESFVIATPRPGMMNEVVVVVVTPRKMEPKADATSALQNAMEKAKATAATPGPKYNATSRIPIIGPITVKGEAVALDPPSDDEIIQALKKIPSGRLLAEQSKEGPKQKFEIVREKIADYLDPQEFVPLIGDARLHHAHYKCTVYIESADKTVEQKQIAPCIVYIDHQHFHLIGGA